MRRAPLLAALVLLPGACAQRKFEVSGTITIVAHLRSKAVQPNAVLFIIAKNLGGVPVAIKRLVNPHFPVVFKLEEEDLLVPGSRPPGPLHVEVQLNSHGFVGRPARGDLEGRTKESVDPGGEVHIVIDREV